MSVMVQKSENTAAIAGYIAGILTDCAYPETNCAQIMRCYNKKDRIFSDEKIYMLLSEMNLTAYSARYGEKMTATEIPAYKENDISGCNWRTEWGSIPGCKECDYIIQPWHYQILKMIQFFIYQCEDSDGYEGVIATLKDIEQSLMELIVTASAGYHAAKWE